MFEVLALQVITATIGTLSIGLADLLYQRGRLRQRLHSAWVATSSAGICLPVLIWIVHVFLGDGVVSWGLVGAVGAAMFLWMYCNLLKVPVTRPIRSDKPAPLHRSEKP